MDESKEDDLLLLANAHNPLLKGRRLWELIVSEAQSTDRC